MTRHVKTLWRKTHDGNTESDPTDTLAKAIYDVVNGKTFVGMTCATFGIHLMVILIYDD